MHELAQLSALVHKIEEVACENGTKRVVGVHVRLGAMVPITASLFREHFEESVMGTVAEGANLVVTEGAEAGDALAMEIVLESIELEG
jgi:Zn finger protein HypA/HybF involved in hydrogenase expression